MEYVDVYCCGCTGTHHHKPNFIPLKQKPKRSTKFLIQTLGYNDSALIASAIDTDSRSKNCVFKSRLSRHQLECL